MVHNKNSTRNVNEKIFKNDTKLFQFSVITLIGNFFYNILKLWSQILKPHHLNIYISVVALAHVPRICSPENVEGQFETKLYCGRILLLHGECASSKCVRNLRVKLQTNALEFRKSKTKVTNCQCWENKNEKMITKMLKRWKWHARAVTLWIKFFFFSGRKALRFLIVLGFKKKKFEKFITSVGLKYWLITHMVLLLRFPNSSSSLETGNTSRACSSLMNGHAHLLTKGH